MCFPSVCLYFWLLFKTIIEKIDLKYIFALSEKFSSYIVQIKDQKIPFFFKIQQNGPIKK